MFKILDKRNGEVTAEQQAVFNKISTNNADGYVDGFLNSLRIAKMSSNVISIDSGLLSIQGFRSVNDTLATYTVSVTPSEPIPFQLVATYSHYISDENDTLEITTRPTQELRREPLFAGQNAVYEVELAEFNMTADGIADFTVTLEKIVYNEQDLSELLDKVTKAEQDSATALEKVNELETQVIEKQGTAVYIGDTAQSRVNFTSDPQSQITANKSDISDIISGAQTVGKAKRDADGNVIDTTYSKLSQVVRTDSDQSLTDVEKQQAQKNIDIISGKDNAQNQSIGWYQVAELKKWGTFEIVIAQSYNYVSPEEIHLSVNVGHVSNKYATITQLSGYINNNFTPTKVRVRANADYVYFDIYSPSTSFNLTRVTIKSYLSTNESVVTTDGFTYIGTSDTVDGYSIVSLDLKTGFATTGDIYSNGSPVLVGSAPTWVTGTSGSITLPSSGWYYIQYNFTSILSADYTTAVFYWTSGRQLLSPISYYNELKLQRCLSISSDGVITAYDPTTGDVVSGGNVAYYKLA